MRTGSSSADRARSLERRSAASRADTASGAGRAVRLADGTHGKDALRVRLPALRTRGRVRLARPRRGEHIEAVPARVAFVLVDWHVHHLLG